MTSEMASESTRTVRVAVVGAGLAGLTASYLLNTYRNEDEEASKAVEWDVHLFERADAIGMDHHSISLWDKETKAEWRIDVPMRSLQGGYYRQTLQLYRYLGVSLRKHNYTYNFSTITPCTVKNTLKKSDKPVFLSLRTLLLYNGQNGKAGLGIPSRTRTISNGSSPFLDFNGLFRLLAYLIFLFHVVFHYFRLLVYSSPPCRPPADETFSQWCERKTPKGWLAQWLGIDASWKLFTHDLLLPLFCAICTTSSEVIEKHPADDLLGYVWYTLLEDHLVAGDGVRDVVQNLSRSQSSDSIHLSCNIKSLSPDPNDVSKIQISYTSPNSSGEQTISGFSHIILATQATQARLLVGSYAQSLSHVIGAERPEKNEELDRTLHLDAVKQLELCLSKFTLGNSIVINHTDGWLLPSNAEDRRDLNFIRIKGSNNTRVEDSSASQAAVSPRSNFKCAAERKPDPTTAPSQTPPSLCVSHSHTMTTHILSNPYSNPEFNAAFPQVYQTTNPIISPDQKHILSISRIERGVTTVESKRALEGLSREVLTSSTGSQLGLWPWNWRRIWNEWKKTPDTVLGTLQGAQPSPTANTETKEVHGSSSSGYPGIWICGSYAYPGIPLLEGCVGSARDIVEQGIMKAEGIEWRSNIWRE